MPTIIIRNQFSFSQAWCPQWESEINSLSLRPDAHNNNQKSILFSSGLMPTMPLEREAAYNNWRKTFSDLQVKRLETPNLFDLFSMQLSYKECQLWGRKYVFWVIFNVAEAGVEGGAVCLVVDHRRGVEQQSELEQVSHPVDLLHNWLFWNYRDKGYSNGTSWWTYSRI